MTTIGPTRLLLAEIRARAVALKRRGSERGGGTAADERPPSVAEPSGDWSLGVAQAVGAISPDDPQRQRKAFRAYLQHALAKECGFRHLDDPAFQALVDQVQASMELDRRIQRAMQEAGRLLLEIAGG